MRGLRIIRGLFRRLVAAAGFDPEEFSGHSLEPGFVTSVAEVPAQT
jgi:hypothetical protein